MKKIAMFLLSVSLLSCSKDLPIEESINTYKIEVSSSGEYKVGVFMDGRGIGPYLGPTPIKTSFEYTFKDVGVKSRSIHTAMTEINYGSWRRVTIQLKVYRNGILLSDITNTNHVQYSGIY